MTDSSDGSFTPEVKAAIMKRDSCRCDRCGFRVTTGHFHHRHPRQMGGTNRRWIGMPSNGLLLHPACHDWVEGHPIVALELGLLVKGGKKTSADVPVYRWNGWHRLLDDGSMVKLDTPPPRLSQPEVDGGVEFRPRAPRNPVGAGPDTVPVSPVVDA